MGGGRHYLKEGGFTEYLYETVGEVKVIDGIRAKVVKLRREHIQAFRSSPIHRICIFASELMACLVRRKSM